MLTHAYRLLRIHPGTQGVVHAQPALLCLLCDRLSFSAWDITHRWCVRCRQYLEQVPLAYQGAREQD